MRSFILALLGLCSFISCKTTTTTTTTSDPLLKKILPLVHQEIEEMIPYALEQSIQQLQTSIPITKEQALVLKEHPRLQKILKENQQEFSTWILQQELTTIEKEAALVCLEKSRPMPNTCQGNKVINALGDDVFSEVIHDVMNYSAQSVLDNNWVPENEAGSLCKDVKKGQFYYYMPGGSSEVVYVYRTDSSQTESLDGQSQSRQVTWTNSCNYTLTALEKGDDFRLDFEIIHVASDHYLFLCKAPYEGTEPTLMIGRVNRSLE